MNNLFFSEKDKCLFWITGYSQYDNTSNVVEKINYLNEYSKKFSDFTGVKVEDVKTSLVTNSSAYKYNRVFFVEGYSGDLPETTFVLSDENGFSMWSWLSR